MVAVFLIATILSPDASAGRRIALVIGNGAYANIAVLRNPSNDAELMAETLRRVGFEVIMARDVDRRDMGRAIRDFGTTLRGAGSDAVGLFYYAGHGVQHNGTNYLIPVDAQVEYSADLHLEAFEVADVLAQMADAGNALNLAILDACRNNPFPSTTRSTARGLARVSAFNGSLIAFAAAPGEAALDGGAKNSPYTSALAEAMSTPGLTVEEVFKRARVDVIGATGGAQIPWEESSLTGNFFFVPAAIDPSEAQADEPAAPDEARASQEMLFWETIKDSNNPDLLRAYLEEYPDGVFAPIASIMLQQLTSDGGEGGLGQATREQAPDPAPPAQDEAPPDESFEMAAIAPDAETQAEPEPEEPDPDLPRHIQAALEAVGCDPGVVDGIWGRRSQRALDSFAQHASLTLPDEPISPETLEMIESQEGRVCPLTCSAREEVRDGRCVTKTCPSGQVLNSRGNCVARSSGNSGGSGRSQPSRQRQQPATGANTGPWCTETERRLGGC